MLDEVERLAWFVTFETAAREAAGPRITKAKARRIEAWARAMSMIAEQFTGPDDDELEDA